MNLFALLLLAPFQSSSAQLNQHPAEQDIYLAIPEVQGLLDALQDTPGPVFLRGEVMKPLLHLLPNPAWQSQDSVRLGLGEVLDMPALEPLLPKIQALSFSARASEQSSELLLVLRFDVDQSAMDFRHALATRWGGGGVTLEQGVELQRGQILELPVWLGTKGSTLAICGGAQSTADYFERAQLAFEEPVDGTHSTAQQQLEASGLLDLPSAKASAAIWMVHSDYPLSLLSSLDQKHQLFEGQLANLPAWGICSPQGSARIEVSPMGYRFDCFEPMVHSSAEPLEQELIQRISNNAMLVMAGRPETAEHFGRLKWLLDTTGDTQEIFGESAAKIERLMELLDDDSIVYSNSMNSTSPPKGFVSIAIKQGAGNEERVAPACAEMLTSLTGFPVSEREYRVRNKLTQEKFGFPVYTLMVPKDPNRGMLTPSISPAFAVAGGRLMLCPRVMHLKNELRRLYDGKGLTPENLGPLRSRGLELPTSAQSLVFFDWAEQISTLIGFLPLIAMAIPGLPFEVKDLPSGNQVRSSFPPVFGYSQSDETGTRHHYQSAVGLDALAVIVQLFAKLPPSIRSMLPF